MCLLDTDKFSEASEDQESKTFSNESFIMTNKDDSSTKKLEGASTCSSNDVWILEFDGSCASLGLGAKMVFYIPTMWSFSLLI